MIDDLEDALALVERIRASLPLRAFATKELRRALDNSPELSTPREFTVSEVEHLGDEGGITCILDSGSDGAQKVRAVSITHLKFDRKEPLARDIESYCRHRVKQLKKLHRQTKPT